MLKKTVSHNGFTKLFIITTLSACISACGDNSSSEQKASTPSVEQVRSLTVLNDQVWKFILYDNNLDFEAASKMVTSGGSSVQLPHT